MLNLERGMTMWGASIIVALIVIATLLILSLLPPYIENGKVITALKGVASQPMENASRTEIRNALQRRFDIDDVRRVDLKTDLFFEKGAKGATVARISYEVRVPLVYNISAVLSFDESVEIRVRSE